MTKIDFYSGADDKLLAACEVCQKVVDSGARVLLYTPDAATTIVLDKLLSEHPATAATAHCCCTDPEIYEMPVVVTHKSQDFPHYEVLINLQSACLPFFSRFNRVIEIVSLDEADVMAGRERFGFYRDRGYEIDHKDLTKQAG